jgi:phosphate butyryltransferase
MSHIVFFELPNYHKLLMTTDGGMVMYPSLEDKKHIIENATHALRNMGYAMPKHAVVCAIETVNPKMTETVEADALKKMNLSGEITGCIVEGPISYDVAMSAEIAHHKGYVSPHIGDFDCMIMPNMQAGNILGKCFTVTVGAPMAGIIVGAKAPAVMTSRGSDANEKFFSIAMAALAAED